MRINYRVVMVGEMYGVDALMVCVYIYLIGAGLQLRRKNVSSCHIPHAGLHRLLCLVCYIYCIVHIAALIVVLIYNHAFAHTIPFLVY